MSLMSYFATFRLSLLDTKTKGEAKMNWEAIGSIGEIVGGAAVRDNTRSQQAATYHSMVAAKNQVNLKISTSGFAPAVLLKGSRDYQSLELEDKHRFNLLMRAILGVCEDIYVQHSKGLADTEDHEINLAMVHNLLQQEGIAQWLSRNHYLFREEFLAAVVGE
jgi:hypothetical protein